MVIVTDKVGQMCNRLFHFASFISNAIEYDYELRYPCFDEYKENFSATANNSFSPFRINTNVLGYSFFNEPARRLLRRLSFLLPNAVHYDISDYDSRGADFDMSDPAFVKLARTKILVTNGWLYRDTASFSKHRHIIRSLFTPISSVLAEVESLIASLRAQADCLVGVHMRRGDYKEFLGGKYYYSTSSYVARISELNSALSAQGKRCLFLICSNENQDPADFGQLRVSTGQRKPLVDLYSLARCDYLIGPPSTFTLWASFYGDVPLFTMLNSESAVELGQFKTFVEGLQHNA